MDASELITMLGLLSCSAIILLTVQHVMIALTGSMLQSKRFTETVLSGKCLIVSCATFIVFPIVALLQHGEPMTLVGVFAVLPHIFGMAILLILSLGFNLIVCTILRSIISPFSERAGHIAIRISTAIILILFLVQQLR